MIVAAGASARFGSEKLAAEFGGHPVLWWTLSAFQASDAISRIIVVTAEERIEGVRELAKEAAPKCDTVVRGGPRRRDSVERGLRASRSRYVAIQDGARPFVTPALIAATVAAAEGKAGAIPAAPLTDTVKEVREGMIVGHPERSLLRAVQTPQVVLRQAWLDAAATSDNDETDDAAMLSRLGLECVAVEGEPDNIKVTRPIDLILAEAILSARGGR